MPVSSSRRPDRPLLRYRVGPAARRRLRERGLGAHSVGVLVGPASGPKWLALYGIDRALLASDLIPTATKTNAEDGDAAPPRRQLLVGASAGAWRMLAFASRDPETRHDALLEGYVGKVFERGVTADTVSRAYDRMVGELFDAADVEQILHHPRFDVAAHAVRVRRPWPVGLRAGQWAWLGAAAVANFVHPAGLDGVAERVLFHSRPEAFGGELRGRLVPWHDDAFHAVAMATASVPLALLPVHDPPHAPPGVYVDGGVTDYHLATRYLGDDDDRVVLFPHYQERIAPGWFDKHLERRRAGPDLANDLLQIHPTDEWIASLPGGRPPDRRDFDELVDQPEERIRRWRDAIRRSEALGEELLDDLETGRWEEKLEASES